MASKAVGVDIGTAFFQVAEKTDKNTINVQTIRNAFVEMNAIDDTEEVLKRNNWNYIKDGNQFFIVGDDAMKVAKMFPDKVQIRRPLQDGVLNKGEDKKVLVLDQLIEKSVGNAPDDKSVISTCVSSDSVDDSPNSEFHKRRIEALFKSRGWNVKIIDEALAIILSERPVVIEPDGTESPYSGLAISLGGGRVNCVLAYKGVQIIGMSAKNSGDWIDAQVIADTGLPEAQVVSYKENKLDFGNIETELDFALDAYYGLMIRKQFALFSKKFQEVQSQFDAPMDIILAGGTSMPKGFVNKVKSEVSKLNLPFKIKDIRHAKNPRNAVVEGLLAHAIASQKKIEKEKINEMLEK